MNRNSNSKSGFTLIELLVVIAIIAILAAIIFPAFASAREKARQTSCSSNEKQLGLAFLQYEQDYDEMLPAVGDSFSNESAVYQCGGGWAGMVYPYVKSTGVYHCPDDPTVPAATVPQGTYVSYIFNAELVDRYNYTSGSSNTYHPLNSPSKSVLLAEGRATQAVAVSTLGEDACTRPGELFSASGSGVDIFQASPYDPCLDYVTTYDAGDMGGYNNADLEQLSNDGLTWGGGSSDSGAVYTAPEIGRHSTGSNFLFADGHVKWLMPGSVSPGYNANSPTDPQSNPASPANYPVAAGTQGDITLPSGAHAPCSATFSAI